MLANETAPWNLRFIQTLGAAYYRLKRYEETLQILARAAGLRSELGPSARYEPPSYEMVLTAMAHRQLGHRDEAGAELDRVRRVLLAGDPDMQALFEEATALIRR